MSFSNQELEDFKAEALDLLEVAEKNLLALDLGAEFRPAFDATFRVFHNLKGAAGMMDLTDLQAHTHELENLLIKFTDAPAIPKVYVDLFLRGIDAARSLMNGEKTPFNFSVPEIAETPPPQDPPVEVKKLEEAAPTPAPTTTAELIPASAVDEFVVECEEIVDRVSDALQLIESGKHNKETLEGLYREIHSLKGSAYLFSFQLLGDISHAMESSLEGVRNETHLPSVELINVLFQCIKVIDAEVQGIKNKTTVAQTEKSVPELSRILHGVAAQLVPVSSPSTASKGSVAASEANSLKEKDGEGNGSIRVSVSLLDNLMTLMGEMVLVRNQVLQFSTSTDDLEFLNLSKRLNVVTNEIQGEMMKTRMQPIGNILSKFNRVVRDLSQDLKKEINLTLSGAETELDKSLLEAIKDPLTHIVRNSCDHGIESPDVRLRSGKSKVGTIAIRSYHESGQVIIEVEDDGKGLNKDVLLRKALERSLITQSQAESMNEKEIYNLIFAPGFSTAPVVTNVSGRGVGMDVVRTNVERIGGSIELSSKVGGGTTTKLKIPLTLAIVPALVVRSGGGTYAIPQVKLEELVRVDQSSEAKVEYLHGVPVYRLRGRLLPLVNLRKVLGFEVENRETTNIVVLSADQCSFGLIVDEVLDTADIVVKPINRLLKSLQIYSGATILGEGSIALILDVLGVSKVAQVGAENAKIDEMKGREEEKTQAELQEFLLVRFNSPTKHAIVLGYVHRLEEFKKSQIEYSGNQRVVRYGKSVLPIISVCEHLGYGPPSAKEVLPVVVIQKAGILYGLEVEEIIDTLSTTEEVDSTLVKQNGVFGHLSLKEELIVAIDPFELINQFYPESIVKPVTHFTAVNPDKSNLKNGTAPRNMNILLVEDTVFFRRAIGNVLSKEGHDVTMVVDGREAMETLENESKTFDLIVSDIEMPRMNGFELAKAIRANHKFSSLPILAISSRADRGSMEIGLKSGFNVYLEKLKPTLLLDAVTKLTGTSREIQ